MLQTPGATLSEPRRRLRSRDKNEPPEDYDSIELAKSNMLRSLRTRRSASVDPQSQHSTSPSPSPRRPLTSLRNWKPPTFEEYEDGSNVARSVLRSRKNLFEQTREDDSNVAEENVERENKINHVNGSPESVKLIEDATKADSNETIKGKVTSDHGRTGLATKISTEISTTQNKPANVYSKMDLSSRSRRRVRDENKAAAVVRDSQTPECTTPPRKAPLAPPKPERNKIRLEYVAVSGNEGDAGDRCATKRNGAGRSKRDEKDDDDRLSTHSLDWLSSAQLQRRRHEADELIGFATLPDQVHRKAVKRGFDFTLMVVGESGLGKSTLVSSLFLNEDLYRQRRLDPVQERLRKTVQIEKKLMEIEEHGVRLRLTIVDTPGFNDTMEDGASCWQPIEDYINEQFAQYLRDESGVNRRNIQDNRVHCCLYFVSPVGHGLKPIDVVCMKRLHHLVNVVPVLAKTDTLTKNERKRLKQTVREQIERHEIRIYEFPECDSDEDEEFREQDRRLKEAIPFAVVGSNTVVEVGGKKVRGRLYPWGIVEVDNPNHCDFSLLRQMLISTHMQDLKDVTRDVHYENFRASNIHDQLTVRERNKLKRESSPNFESVIAAERLLLQKDEEIQKMQQKLEKMQMQMQGGKPPLTS